MTRSKALRAKRPPCRNSPFLGVVPVAVIALGRKVDLPRLNLRLLQAEDIGIKRRKSLGKALADARSYSVDIP